MDKGKKETVENIMDIGSGESRMVKVNENPIEGTYPEQESETQDPIQYQWVRGENYGFVEDYVKDISDGEDTYLLFKSGRRVNKNVMNEYVMLVDETNPPLTENINPRHVENVSNTTTRSNTLQKPKKNDPAKKVKKVISGMISRNVFDVHTTNISLDIPVIDMKTKVMVELMVDGDIENIDELISECVVDALKVRIKNELKDIIN